MEQRASRRAGALGAARGRAVRQVPAKRGPDESLDVSTKIARSEQPQPQPQPQQQSSTIDPLLPSADTLAAIRELQPHLAPPQTEQFGLDSSLPDALSFNLPLIEQQIGVMPEPPRKGDQDKAREAFVAAHAGQTYEQMVLERAYSSDRLHWLKEAYGLSWRTGRWTAEEEERATLAIEQFCQHYKLSQAALDELIWNRRPEQKHMHEELWKHVAMTVGTRPNYAVRMHIKSMRKAVVRGGRWSTQDINALSAAVAELGHQWERIGERVGRSGNVCKHFWRDQMKHANAAPVARGAFSQEEEDALRRTVLECCARVGVDPEGPNLPWTLIHERLGPSTRRISVLSRKWRGMLSAERRGDDEARWYAPRDDHVLVARIRAQGKSDAADVDFDQLASADWQWPLYVIKKHWAMMVRRRVPEGFRGTLDEMLDTIAAKTPSPEEYKNLTWGRRNRRAE